MEQSIGRLDRAARGSAAEKHIAYTIQDAAPTSICMSNQHIATQFNALYDAEQPALSDEYYCAANIRARGITPIMRYTMESSIRPRSGGRIRKIVNSHRSKINVQNSIGWTALHIAAANPNIISEYIFNTLCELGADVSSVDRLGNRPIDILLNAGTEYPIDIRSRVSALIARGARFVDKKLPGNVSIGVPASVPASVPTSVPASVPTSVPANSYAIVYTSDSNDRQSNNINLVRPNIIDAIVRNAYSPLELFTLLFEQFPRNIIEYQFEGKSTIEMILESSGNNYLKNDIIRLLIRGGLCVRGDTDIISLLIKGMGGMDLTPDPCYELLILLLDAGADPFQRNRYLFILCANKMHGNACFNFIKTLFDRMCARDSTRAFKYMNERTGTGTSVFTELLINKSSNYSHDIIEYIFNSDPYSVIRCSQDDFYAACSRNASGPKAINTIRQIISRMDSFTMIGGGIKNLCEIMIDNDHLYEVICYFINRGYINSSAFKAWFETIVQRSAPDMRLLTLLIDIGIPLVEKNRIRVLEIISQRQKNTATAEIFALIYPVIQDQLNTTAEVAMREARMREIPQEIPRGIPLYIQDPAGNQLLPRYIRLAGDPLEEVD